MADDVVIVAGMGEVGQPLCRILSNRFDCVGVDVQPANIEGPCSTLHICYPFHIPDFVGVTARYVEKYSPTLVIVNSTVAPGTTRRIQHLVGSRPVVYSPVRGKHARMEADMLRYKKFVAGFHVTAVELALAHFRAAGFKTDTFRTPELAELSKLLETTYLGVLIAWAQEVERVAGQFDASFSEVNAFIEEIDFLPSHIVPGYIGGHCVMPNIAILEGQVRSSFLEAIVESNKNKGLRGEKERVECHD